MRHTASKRFWQCLDALPTDVQSLARKNYALLKTDPGHPSLQFKQLGGGKLWSVRVGLYTVRSVLPRKKVCIGSGLERTASTTNSSANMLIDTDTQQYKAAPQQLLRAGHRRR